MLTICTYVTVADLKNKIIQIWNCDKGNMEFYGPEAIILTEVKPRSILLLKIHKTHISRHHRTIFALLYVKCYGSSILVY